MTTRIGDLARELTTLNPWWRSPTAWEDEDLRRVRESGIDYKPTCLDDLVEGGLYVLRGPRRVGKTVATKVKIAELVAAGVNPRAIVRAAVDGWSPEHLRTLVQNTAVPYVPDGTSRWWFIDEITSVTGDWASQVKWLRDNHPAFAGATVVLTGSNASGLTGAIGTLAGRRGPVAQPDRTLLPIGFRTFARLFLRDALDVPRLPLDGLHTRQAYDSYQELLPWLDDLVRAWDLYLQVGGFPIAVAAAHRGEPIPDRFVADMFDVVFRDVFGASQMSQADALTLYGRIMAGMASPMNYHTVARDAGTTVDVTIRHVEYLRNAYLAWHCPQKAHRRWTARDRAQDKVYSADPLLARLPHLHNPAREDVDPTVLTEMALGVAIRRAADAAGRSWAGDTHLFYHRTPARKEIDFVSDLFAGAAIEGKFVSDGGWRGEAATVEASGWLGLVATRTVLDCTTDQGAWAVPAAFLAYLIDC
jgi:predicted AAA+ superfamily ATPase